MVHVGLECTIDRSQIKKYGWDYAVAFTAATLPWIFCTLYFVYGFPHAPNISSFTLWTESLLLGRFAAPTSAGVLFTMLAAAGLAGSWLFKKARILAIFDDIDTLLLLIPLKMMLIGFQWELFILIVFLLGLIYIAWQYLHKLSWPTHTRALLFYAAGITLFCEMIYLITDALESVAPLEIEVLLPAFVLGCVLLPSAKKSTKEKNHEFLISALFLFLVGASMPLIDFSNESWNSLSFGAVLLDVVLLTLLSNLGKCFPLFCYKKEASFKERLALSIGMCSRGEVGAGIIVVSLGLITHLSQQLIFLALISLTLNLLLTGPFILLIQKLVRPKTPLQNE